MLIILRWEDGQTTGLQVQTHGNESQLETETHTETEYSAGEEDSAVLSIIGSEDADLLVLVNKEEELSGDYDPKLTAICGGRLEASARLYEDLCAMIDAAEDAGYEFWIASAYRSRQRQQELVDEDVEALMKKGEDYEEALSETYRETMPAGHSEHETGLALDILCSGNNRMDVSQAEEPGNQWLAEHCWEYGFIVRYPEGKEDVTGISYEPWHFRYVGKEAAKFIAEQGITLEEYVAGQTK